MMPRFVLMYILDIIFIYCPLRSYIYIHIYLATSQLSYVAIVVLM